MTRRVFDVRQTHGILWRPENRIEQSSDRLGWSSIYVSQQYEQPFDDSYEPVQDHLGGQSRERGGNDLESDQSHIAGDQGKPIIRCPEGGTREHESGSTRSLSGEADHAHQEEGEG